MTQDINDDMSATIQAAEENILRISQELRRMKTAADLLEDAGQRSQQLHDAVESLVTEIGSLVGLSGRIIDAMNELEVDRLATELRATLIHCMDGLKSEVTADARSASERVGAELQIALSRRMDLLSSGITAKTESANNRILKRLDEIDSQVKELRKVVDQQTKRKGIFF
ncbi:MAG: hypothetical protein OXJ55_05215 [Caldilineaceae bacterium]|nr:hypothetical protein [Caldilineaceae bacterium]